MQEALALAKDEFGENAVVLNTKHVRSGGVLGIGSSGKVELMAAADEAAGDHAVPVGSFAPTFAPPSAPSSAVAVAEPVAGVMSSLAARLYSEARGVIAEPDSEVKQLRSELAELSGLVHSLMGGIRLDERPPGESLLARLGVDGDIAEGPLAELLSIDDPAVLTSAIASKLHTFAQPPMSAGRQVIALVGPTGVGKTTTLAKLAAKFSLELGKKVALVTADTYRIGAVDQLKTYARIMGIPLEIGLSPEEVAAGVEKHGDKDVVLVDTVGRSQRSSEHLAELKSFVDAAKPTDTCLVVAASLAGDIQREVVDKFAQLSPTKLIITKLDEALNCGCLLNLPLRTGLGVSCLTAGQNVPQDIELAEAGKMARAIVSEVA